MKTEQLIDMLVAGAEPTRRHAVARQLVMLTGSGVLGALVLVWVVYGINPDLVQLLVVPAFWTKMAFVIAIAAGGLVLTARLARPDGQLAGIGWIVTPVLLIWGLAVYSLAQAEPGSQAHLVFGNTWRTCAFNIALASAPAFVAGVWALKQLAPTRLRPAGAAAGLAAGGLGASLYALHCPELAAPFLGIWYVLGMLIPVLVGAAAGPRLLRW